MTIDNYLIFRLPAGICRVTVVQAENLRDADYLDKSDPYCIVKIGCEERKVNVMVSVVLIYDLFRQKQSTTV